MIYPTPVASIYNRRPAAPRAPVLAVASPALWVRRPAPSPAQFAATVNVGAIGTAASRVVQLRRRDGTVLETIKANAGGAFSMRGWYPVRADYELHVLGDDYVSRSFPTAAPAAVQWNGNPRLFPSTPTP